MASLSTAAAKRLDRINKRPRLPEWWELFAGALVAVLLVALALGMIRSSAHSSKVAGPPLATLPAPSTGAGTPGTGTPVQAPTPPSTAPEASGSEALPASSGSGTVTVPKAAVQAATAAALANYTNNFSAVPLAPGSKAPQLLTSFPNAAVNKTTVTAATPTSVTFDFIVAPDGVALDGLRSLPIQVVADKGTWVYPVPPSSGAGS